MLFILNLNEPEKNASVFCAKNKSGNPVEDFFLWDFFLLNITIHNPLRNFVCFIKVVSIFLQCHVHEIRTNWSLLKVIYVEIAFLFYHYTNLRITYIFVIFRCVITYRLALYLRINFHRVITYILDIWPVKKWRSSYSLIICLLPSLRLLFLALIKSLSAVNMCLVILNQGQQLRWSKLYRIINGQLGYFL